MPRKVESLRIGDKEFIIKEMRVHEIISLWEALEKGIDFKSLPGEVDNFCKQFIEGLDFEAIKWMAPSEIERIFQKFQKVNRPFFQFCRVAGLGEVFSMLRNQFHLNFMRHVSNSR